VGPRREALELVVFVGLPASGKSSFYRARFAATHALVSKDLMPNNRRRAARQLELVTAALRAGRPVVVDNTNTRRADRAELLQVAAAWRIPAVVYHFTATVETCLARNRAREGKARVPDVALFTAKKLLEPPGDDEGFAARYDVAILAPVGDSDINISDSDIIITDTDITITSNADPVTGKRAFRVTRR
jgi:predicted kinase